MSCSILALQTCPGAIWQGLASIVPWWAPWAFWIIVAVAVLWGLSQVKNVAGTPGVVAVIVAIVAVWENVRGRQGKGVIPVKLDFGGHENIPADSPDAVPTNHVSGVRQMVPRPTLGATSKVTPKDDGPPPSLSSH